MLSSENEEVLISDSLADEITTQAAIDETIIEMTDEMVAHEMPAHMEDNVSENQQIDMHVENELNENHPHLTSLNDIQVWICMVLLRIYFKFKLTKAALCQFVWAHITSISPHCSSIVQYVSYNPS